MSTNPRDNEFEVKPFVSVGKDMATKHQSYLSTVCVKDEILTNFFAADIQYSFVDALRAL